MPNSKVKRVLSVLGLAIIGLLVAAVISVTLSPAGRYREDKIGSERTAYYELHDGKVVLSVPVGSQSSDSQVIKQLGNYVKHEGRWIFVTNDGETNTLVARLLSLQIIGQDGSWTQSYPRILVGP